MKLLPKFQAIPGCAPLRIGFILKTLLPVLMLALSAAHIFAQSTIMLGPFYPPPFNYNFVESGTSGDGGMARSSGKTFTFNNLQMPLYTTVYWGPVNSGIGVSFINSQPSGSEIMSFAGVTNLGPNTTIYYTGSTGFYGNVSGYIGVTTRCRIVVPNVTGESVVATGSAGIFNSSAGYVTAVNGLTSFSVTMYLEVLWGGNWMPAYDWYDAERQAEKVSSGLAYSTFNGTFWYLDHAPTLGATVQSVVAGVGKQAGPFPFTASDPDSGGSFTLSGINLGVPMTFNYGSSNGNPTLYFTPSSIGTANVGVKATDSSGAVNSLYFLNVSVDGYPTVSALPNRTIQMNSNAVVPFAISDFLLAPNNLTIFSVSSNTTVVPLANLQVFRTNNNCGLQITPAANKYGVFGVGVIVSNQVLATTNTLILTVNSPPSLSANNILTVVQSSTATITSSYLQATDPDNQQSQIIFTVNPDGQGGPPHNGQLLKSGSTLTTGSTFTMADVLNGFISYHNSGSCDTSDDFQFGVTDTSGGVLSDTGHTVFSFHISIQHAVIAPVPIGATNLVPLGGSATGTLSAVNTDCVNSNLSYSIVGSPSKGTVSNFNASTGQYTYYATPGQSGADSFAFTAYNGGAVSQPGTVTLKIQNTPPTGVQSNYAAVENVPLTNHLAGTDSDRPAQTLTFTIATNASKGMVTLINSTNGTFVYMPNSNRFGQDTFAFTVNDGTTNSQPALAQINVRPSAAHFGDLLVSESTLPSIRLVNPTNGDVGIISSGGIISSPAFMATEPDGHIVVADLNAGILRIDGATGAQSYVYTNTTAIGIAREATGNLLISQPFTGLLERISSNGVAITNISLPGFAAPAGIVVAANGQIHVVNAGFIAGNAASNAILQIDPVTLASTVYGFGAPLLASPVGLAVEPSGNLLVTEPFVMALTRLTLPGGTFSNLVSGSPLTQPFAVATDLSTNIYLLDQGKNANSGFIARVNPVTGALSLVAAPGTIGSPFAMATAGLPLMPPQPTGIQFIASAPQISFTGYPGTTYRVLRTTDLTLPVGSWTPLAAPIEISPGNFTISDSADSSVTARFYRIVFP